MIDDVPGMHRIDRLLSEVWGGGPQDAVSVNMMKALAHTGHYVAGAWRDGDVVGAAEALNRGGISNR